MARKRVARFCFALALVTMPLSYAVKGLAGGIRMTWVDPTLPLGLVTFILIGWQIRRKPGSYLFVLAVLSAISGAFLHAVQAGRNHGALYVIFADPGELFLCLVWFWVCIYYLQREREFAVRWLAMGAIFEFIVACYMYLAMLGLLWAPMAMEGYLDNYRLRQAISVSSGSIPRMGGTFQESPLFGLYMLSCLVILTLEWMGSNRDKISPYVYVGVIVSAMGAIASLSDQVLLGLAIFLGLAFIRGKRCKTTAYGAALLFAVIICLFVGDRMLGERRPDTDVTVYGQSMGERSFHAHYALKILGGEPFAIVLGIGPGRYGDYAASTGRFPSTVTPQITAVEWLAGYGFIGFSAICFWLYEIGERAWRFLGLAGIAALLSLLVADMFQSRWLWESWFMALAYLYASAAYPICLLPGCHKPSIAVNGGCRGYDAARLPTLGNAIAREDGTTE